MCCGQENQGHAEKRRGPLGHRSSRYVLKEIQSLKIFLPTPYILRTLCGLKYAFL